MTTARILGAVVEKTGKTPVFVHYGKDLGRYGSVIFAREEFLTEKPEVAKRTFEAIECAYNAAREDPDMIGDTLVAEFSEKKRDAEMAAVEAGLGSVFGTDSYEKYGFGWDMDRLTRTYENTMLVQGGDATADPADFIYVVPE